MTGPFKSLVKSLARRAGLVVVTSHHLGARYVERPPRGPLDEILLRVFPRLDGLTFIQVGANDGVRTDPIRHYVIECGWTGLLVEPVPALFAQLQENYAPYRGLNFLNAAIDAQVGDLVIYRVAPGFDIPEWARGVVSFDRAHVVRLTASFVVPAEAIVSEKIRTVTWAEIRKAFGPRHCDVLVIDVEGYDIQLLRQADLGRFKPTVIQFEHTGVPAGDRLDFYRELIDTGYEIATAGQDTVAYLPADRRHPAP